MGIPTNVSDQVITSLAVFTCYLIEAPDSRIDCSEDNKTCIFCPLVGRYLAGDGFYDYTSPGHIICFFLSVLIFIIGVFGTFANLFIMLILKRQNTQRAFDTLLVSLAGFDFLCSVSSLITTICTIFYLQNWSRNGTTVTLSCGTLLIALFARSGSSFMTVLITVERYLVIAFPTRLGNWFTLKRTRMLVLAVFVWSLALAIPRCTSLYVEYNEAYRNIETTKDTDYIVVSTQLAKFWFVDMKGFFDVIDFWGPLPLLLLFNGLVYFYVRRFEQRRKQLNITHSKDISTAKMFLSVVIVLFLCNIVPIIHYYTHIVGIWVYREISFGVLLSWTVNSAVNLPIYYLQGSSFRKETRNVLSSYFTRFTSGGQSDDRNNGDTSAPK